MPVWPLNMQPTNCLFMLPFELIKEYLWKLGGCTLWWPGCHRCPVIWDPEFLPTTVPKGSEMGWTLHRLRCTPNFTLPFVVYALNFTFYLSYRLLKKMDKSALLWSSLPAMAMKVLCAHCSSLIQILNKKEQSSLMDMLLREQVLCGVLLVSNTMPYMLPHWINIWIWNLITYTGYNHQCNCWIVPCQWNSVCLKESL